MSLIKALGGAVKGFVGSGGSPVGAFLGAQQANRAESLKKKQQRAIDKYNQEFNMRFNVPSNFPQSNNGLQFASGDSGGFLGGIRSGIREIGGLASDLFDSGLPSLFGFNRPISSNQQPAITVDTGGQARETSGSGTVEAFVGPTIPRVLDAARNLLKTPGGQIGIGTAVGLGGSMLDFEGKKKRITRKMKSQARMVLNLVDGDLAMASQILNIDQNLLITILLKRFRNDGPVVTKAALRKTKSTIRRLHNMQDVLKSIAPRSTPVRRAPMKRSTTTLIKN